MSLFDLFVLAVGLSMDALAVSICKGLALKKVNWKHMAVVGLWFGGFQALMPALGYFLGSAFSRFVSSFAPVISFVLLALIGGNMLRESFSKEEEDAGDSLGFKTMLAMAVATSIDAFAVGVTFAFDGFTVPRMLLSVLLIGVTTFGLSGAGVKIGSAFGAKHKVVAERVGGITLILLGIKLLLSGYNLLPF